MSSRIELRGVIVPSDWDIGWMEDFIKKGIIIPESRFRKQLAAVDTGQPLTIHVNSPGGSVFAANEMVNAVKQWKIDNSQKVTVVVGAWAASAASMFTVAVNDEVHAHQNSMMMFHGAFNCLCGGADAMADNAELLDKINANIKKILVTRYNMAPELVDEWFAEGREGWLTTEEMEDAGIVKEVIDEDAPPVKFPKVDIGTMQQRGFGVAALVQADDIIEKEGDDDAGGDKSKNKADDKKQTDDKKSVDDKKTDDKKDDKKSGDKKTATDTVEVAAVKVEYAEKLAQLKKDHAAELKKRDETLSKLQSEKDKALAENVKVTERANGLDARLTKLLGGSLNFSSTVETWDEAMKACDNDYAKAREKFPNAYATQRQADKDNRKETK